MPEIRANTCPYCHGAYTLAAGGCVAKCVESQRHAARVAEAAEADVTEADEVVGLRCNAPATYLSQTNGFRACDQHHEAGMIAWSEFEPGHHTCDARK